ncbi:hypothetical protein V5799_017559, partial [Amblyomma americanum]
MPASRRRRSEPASCPGRSRRGEAAGSRWPVRPRRQRRLLEASSAAREREWPRCERSAPRLCECRPAQFTPRPVEIEASRRKSSDRHDIEVHAKEAAPDGSRPAAFDYDGSGEEITSIQRNHTVKWLTVLNRYLKFNPETLFLSVTLMDEFLRLVRAQPKYLKCIAISCFYLASKIIEEDEFYALLVLNRSLLLPDRSEQQLAALGPLLETKLQICLDQASLVATRPSTLALAVLSLELETWTPNWFVITIALQRLAQ